jgi:hypothetical protein
VSGGFLVGLGVGLAAGIVAGVALAIGGAYLLSWAMSGHAAPWARKP